MVSPAAATPATGPGEQRQPEVPAAALEGVKSKRRSVLALSSAGGGSLDSELRGRGLLPPAAAAAEKGALFVGLGARAAVFGVSEAQLQGLREDLALADCDTEASSTSSGSESSPSLQLATLAGLRVSFLTGQAGDCPWDRLAAGPAPHVLCADAAELRGDASARAAVKAFKGAVLLLASPQRALTEEEQLEEDDFIRALGVSSRFHVGEAGLAPLPEGAALVTQVLGDVKHRQLAEGGYAALCREAQELYDEYFHGDLVEDIGSWENSSVAFMVATSPGEADRFMGLIVYKHWGAPLRTMSVLRVLVSRKFRKQGCGRVLMRWVIEKARALHRSQCTKLTLCATPEAIPFYERLQFKPIPQDELQSGPADPSLPQPLPGSLWMELKCGRQRPTGRR